jgi:hypothetical protein
MHFFQKLYESKDFFNFPEDPTSWIPIFEKKMLEISKILQDAQDNQDQIQKIQDMQSILLKEHTLREWQDNLHSLDEFLKSNNPLFPLDDELIQETYEFLSSLHSLQEESQIQLKLIQQGKYPDTKIWQSLDHRFQGSCHIIKSIVHYLVTLYHQYPWSNHSFL